MEATVLAKLMEKAGLLPMSLTARKINERSECVTKIIPIPYTAYVHRVFMYMLEVKIKGVRRKVLKATIGIDINGS